MRALAAQYSVLARVLYGAGWIPANCVEPWAFVPGADLLPAILETWSRATKKHSNNRLNVLVVRRLEQARAHGAQLVCCPLRASAGSFEERLLWCPQGLPAARRIAVLSSHLGRRPDELREWFQALREIVEQRHNQDQFVIAGTATASVWLETATAELGAPLLAIDCPTGVAERRGAAAWLRRVLHESNSTAGRIGSRAWLSPALAASESSDQALVADRTLLEIADELYLLRLVRGGRLERLLGERLPASAARPTVHLAIGPRLVPAAVAESLVAQGCIAWRYADTSPALRRMIVRVDECAWPQVSTTLCAETMLTHWTRAAAGAWPDQTESDYRRDLVLDRPAAERGPLATLLRILAMRRICASARAIRGGFAVVCFTAVRFDEFSRRCVFRRHRGRWDFGPYGISISRRWLEAHGARPVIYGDERTWSELTPQERPFFQSAGAQERWSSEMEWRVVGDVDLSAIPVDQAWLFAPTRCEARWLALLSRWPVRVMDITSPTLSRP